MLSNNLFWSHKYLHYPAISYLVIRLTNNTTSTFLFLVKDTSYGMCLSPTLKNQILDNLDVAGSQYRVDPNSMLTIRISEKIKVTMSVKLLKNGAIRSTLYN